MDEHISFDKREWRSFCQREQLEVRQPMLITTRSTRPAWWRGGHCDGQLASFSDEYMRNVYDDAWTKYCWTLWFIISFVVNWVENDYRC
jgi:hypothetical protein